LAEEEEKDSGNTVGHRIAVAVEKFLERCQTLFLGERAARRGRLLIGDVHGVVQCGFFGPDEEVSDL
jgi:hypothetical protein